MKRKKIHEPYNKFKGVLRERNITYNDIAKILDISNNCVSFKINGYSDFFIKEYLTLKKVYGFEMDIFFNQKVAN